MSQASYSKQKALWLFFSTMLFLLQIQLSYSQEAANNEAITVGSGSKIGAYYAFVQNLKRQLQKKNIQLINRGTEGSKENLRLIQSGKLDAAVVQNDIAYYRYYDKQNPNRDFRAALPLFAEYFQIIVRKDSGILHIDSLIGKRIALGARESGSYRNAKDILKSAEISFTPVPVTGLDDALQKLKAGTVDAVAYTGAALPPDLRQDQSILDVLSLPDSLIENLTRQYPYFYQGQLARKGQDAINTVNLMAYLVLSQHISEANTDRLLRQIYNNWNELADAENYRLISLGSLREAIQRKPTPLHHSARKLLVEEGYLFDPWAISYYLLGLILITLLVHYFAHHVTTRYDRLGNLQPIKCLWRYQLTLLLQGVAVLVAMLTVMALVYFAIMLTIQYYEGRYATEHNLYNQFATMGIPDLMLWLWGWIGGYDSGVFPQSTIGKILVVFPPLVGLFSIAWLVFSVWRDVVGRKVAEQKGAFVSPLKNHVLICGWNEKARGIIFGLTTSYAPERKKVVVIAEMEEAKPLEEFNFPKGMVHYYRGDSSDSKALEAAHASNASAALILAGEKKKQAGNIGSVLTTLAIKQQSHHVFTVAELRHQENIQKFEACDIDALVFAETIIFRLAAQACFNPLAVSWFFDMITHDEQAEMYAMPWGVLMDNDVLQVAKELFLQQKGLSSLRKAVHFIFAAKGLGKNKASEYPLTVSQLRHVLAQQGISLVAVFHMLEGEETKVMVQHTFSNDQYSNFVSDQGEKLITKDDVIIYSAMEKEDIYVAANQILGADMNALGEPLPSPNNSTAADCKVLLIGNIKQCEGVIGEIKELQQLHYQVLTESQEPSQLIAESHRTTVDDLLEYNQWCDCITPDINVVIVLADAAENKSTCLDSDRGELDAKTLLIARQVSREACTGRKPFVIAEMLGRNSRDLFISAGVDVVLPRSLLVERIMTKMAYGYGVVSNYLMAVLALNDKAYLNNIVLVAKDSDWLNLSYEELFLQMPANLQLLAIAPVAPELNQSLANEYQDFAQHYIACPAQAELLGYKSQAGDRLLVLDGRTVIAT